MGEKGNVAAQGSSVVDHVTGGVESGVSTVAQVARTVGVGVGTTIATEELQHRRAQAREEAETDTTETKEEHES